MAPAGEAGSRQRTATLFIVAGAAIAVVSLALAAAAGGPYLSLDRLSPWLVSYAIGLFAALLAVPFALHGRLGGTLEAEARWERALLWWGALALGLLVVGLVVGSTSGFAPSDSLADSAGLVAAGEALLVLGTLAVWLISG